MSNYAIYVGVNRKNKDSILRFSFDPGAMQLCFERREAALSGISCMVMQDRGNLLFASACKQGSGLVASFRLNPSSGTVQRLSQVGCQIGDISYLSADLVRCRLYACSYTSGSIACFTFQEDGDIELVGTLSIEGSGPKAERQDGSHLRCAIPAPGGNYCLVPDLGAGRVWVLHIEENVMKNIGYWEAWPGMRPRHLAFHPDGKTAYLLTELFSQLVVLSWDAEKGHLTHRHTLSSLTDHSAMPSNYPTDIVVSADGRFVYVSNKGSNDISCFAWDAVRETLRPQSYIKTLGFTRAIQLSPDDDWLFALNGEYNSCQGRIQVYARNPQKGELYFTGCDVCAPFACHFICTPLK